MTEQFQADPPNYSLLEFGDGYVVQKIGDFLPIGRDESGQELVEVLVYVLPPIRQKYKIKEKDIPQNLMIIKLKWDFVIQLNHSENYKKYLYFFDILGNETPITRLNDYFISLIEEKNYQIHKRDIILGGLQTQAIQEMALPEIKAKKEFERINMFLESTRPRTEIKERVPHSSSLY